VTYPIILVDYILMW